MIAEISMLPATMASNTALVEDLCHIINRAYEVAEADIWRENYPRTSMTEVSAAIRDEQVAAARLSGQLLGSVFTRQLDNETGWFGGLAVAPAYGGRGIGRELVAFAERRAFSAGLTRMQLEVFLPDDVEIVYSQRLVQWYRRLGYREVSRSPLEEFDADAMAFVATPCQVVVHLKQLVPEIT